ncbi:NAD(P)/FAD-dependent oxidoreductase [Streptomyces sp. PT12]|uniref:NAD(P)/FAD-dependent oxidoreductase n=1 Tax=Streptomyces sp. PT12 TaxID=1510197 RepID=UPI000DE4599E|nr:hypothetical protein [Streptomyces sp. PT12]RBM14140.1 hypothetical protein DEH69_18955 [Streptomyces sp. PT12]
MATTVIAGGGVAGLALALALGGRGHRVRVLERGDPPPDGPVVKSARLWRRPLVPQAAHDHILNGLGVRALRRHAPAVLDAALAEGARLLDLNSLAPPGPDGAAAPRDDELTTLVVRRTVLDVLLYRAAAALPRVTIHHNVVARGLSLAPSGRSGQRVAGVVTDGGGGLPADVVVDASGRASRSRGWLAAAGVAVPADLSSPSRLRAFGRFYRLRDPDGPPPGPLNRGNAAGGIWDHYSAVLHPADNDVFAITFGALPEDRAADGLRTADGFTAACRLSPLLGAWVTAEAAQPLGPVRVIGMPPNLLRGTATDPRPRVTGLLQVGDAACVTDPMFGRGLSTALEHAFELAELWADGAPSAAAAAELAEGLLGPWYALGAHDSWARIARWRAACGLPPLPAADRPRAPVPADRVAAALAAAATDPVVWRGVSRVQNTLATPAEVYGDPEFLARLPAAPAGGAAAGPPGLRPPTHAELRDAIAAQEEG